MTEEWRPVVGFASYEVSNLGRVRNATTGRPLRSWFVANRSGELYEKVGPMRGGVRKRCFVHRLVAQAFIPNPGCRPEINHFDQNTLNNAADNLEWSTRSENESHKRFMRATA
jgi:hypothetical protein